MGTNSSIPKKIKPSPLEMANQMFKDAWLVKRTFFQKKHPELSSDQVDKMTATYFSKLKD